jgi:hypothetical protein
MLKKLACAMAVMVFAFSVAVAEEFMGAIKKVEDGKITVTKFKKGGGKKGKGEEVVLTLASKVKVVNAKFNKEEKKIEPGDALENGLKNDRFKEIKGFGVFSQIVTNDDGKVTEIRVFPPFKGGKGKKPKDDK